MALLLAAEPAQALPCWLIRQSYAVFSSHGVKAAEQWARDHGYSETEIKAARQCLAQRAPGPK